MGIVAKPEEITGLLNAWQQGDVHASHCRQRPGAEAAVTYERHDDHGDHDDRDDLKGKSRNAVIFVIVVIVVSQREE